MIHLREDILKAQIVFLKEQLAYKTFGKPTHEDDK